MASWFSTFFGSDSVEYTDFSEAIQTKLSTDDTVFIARLFQLCTGGEDDVTPQSLAESYSKFEVEGDESKDKLNQLIHNIQNDNSFVRVVSIIEEFDTDGDGSISVFELPAFLETQGLEFAPAVVYAVFHELDEDASGLISKSELEDFLWESFIIDTSVENLQQLLDSAFNRKAVEIEEKNQLEDCNMTIEHAQQFVADLEIESMSRAGFVEKLKDLDFHAGSTNEIARLISDHSLANINEAASSATAEKMGKHHQTFEQLGHSIDGAVYDFLEPLVPEQILACCQRFGMEIDDEDDDWVEECFEELLDEIRNLYLETEKLIQSFGVASILSCDKVFCANAISTNEPY